MTPADVLRVAPLATAGIWLTLAVYLLVRERYRTWSEAFFVGIFLSGGLYALFDVVYFHAPSKEAARLAAHVGLTTLSLAAIFIFLYGVVLRTRMRWRFVLATAPLVAFFPFFGNVFLVDLVPIEGSGAPFQPVYRAPYFLVWIVLLLGYAIAGLASLYRVGREVAPVSPRLGRRLNGLVFLFLAVLLLGFATNAILGFLDVPVVPPFSTLLAIPGAGALLFQERVGAELADAVRRRRNPAYRIGLVFLMYQGGIPIVTRARSGSRDPDVLGANLDVLLTFVGEQDRRPVGRRPVTLVHGGHAIAIVYGRWSYLAVVLEGEPDEALVRGMRHRLNDFEAFNAPVLADWNGDMSRLAGAEGLVARFLDGPGQA